MDKDCDENEEIRKLSIRKKKYRARRFRVIISTLFFSCIIAVLCTKQKFKNRSECVLDREEKYWEAITMEYMSEESDKSDNFCPPSALEIKWYVFTKYHL